MLAYNLKRSKHILFIIIFIFSGGLAKGQNDELLKLPDIIKPKDRICFALYTIHDNILKLTAQFYPIKNFEPFEATLEIKIENEWKQIAETRIIYPGYTAPFRIEEWDDTLEVPYRVVHNEVAFYEGIIRKNPIHKDEFVMAALTCNSIYPEHGGDISRKDIVDNLKRLEPDLLFFSGDQVYDHSEHYLYWLKFGEAFGDIIRNTPTICIPDDHDIGQGNLWGQGGKRADWRRGVSGGYYMPVEYIKEVERAQTSHLPDPYDPTPVEQGIGVYYTNLTWGGISFAILEDRKFKSGLMGMVEQLPDLFPNGPYEAVFDSTIDSRRFDISGATLLGQRQLDFLGEWTTDWKDAEIKSVLSQTIFSMSNNYTGKYDKEIFGDFDSNGWPQTGRNKALSVIRKSYSCMIAGDQHLGSVIKHGVEKWNDAGYSFCTPAIANYWLRWWTPSKPGKNRIEGTPNYTGEYLDGFKNKINVLAIANPTLPEIEAGGYLSTRAAGYGIVRYNKPDRKITFECWGRNIDMFDSKSKQYKGWPITIGQMDNFKIENGFELPKLILNQKNAVVTIRKSLTNELVSSIRLNGSEYQPKTLESGMYNIFIGEDPNKIILYEIASKKDNPEIIKVQLIQDK